MQGPAMLVYLAMLTTVSGSASTTAAACTHDPAVCHTYCMSDCSCHGSPSQPCGPVPPPPPPPRPTPAAEHMLLGQWYSPQLEVIQDSKDLFIEMKQGGVTDVVIAAGYIGEEIYTVSEQHCGIKNDFQLPACVGTDYNCTNAKGHGKCRPTSGKAPTLADIIAHIMPYTEGPGGFKLWIDFSGPACTYDPAICHTYCMSDCSCYGSPSRPCGTFLKAAVADAVMTALRTTTVVDKDGSMVSVLDVIQGVTTDIEPPNLKLEPTQEFHKQLATQLANCSKRYFQWVGAESLTKAYISSMKGLSNFGLVVTAYDRGANPPYPIPPWMYQQLVTHQLGYTIACDSTCQMSAPADAQVCNELTHSPFSPYGLLPKDIQPPQCTNPTGYGNAMCDAQTCPAGVGPLGWKLKTFDPDATIKILIAAPFAATTSEWVHAKGSDNEPLPPGWQPSFSNASVAGLKNYPACVMQHVQFDSVTGVSTNTMVTGQGDYIASLGKALANVNAQDADFGKRFIGIEAYQFSYPVQTIIPVAAPCGGTRAKDPPCGKALVFTTENGQPGVNKVPQSSWDAFKAWPTFSVALPGAASFRDEL